MICGDQAGRDSSRRVELHQRLGSHAEQVPQWFDEGLAVLNLIDRINSGDSFANVVSGS